MTKNLEKADVVVKLTLAIAVLAFYFTQVINGPFAKALALLSGLAILIFLIKWLYVRKAGRGNKG